jgi:hypothetical protein
MLWAVRSRKKRLRFASIVRWRNPDRAASRHRGAQQSPPRCGVAKILLLAAGCWLLLLGSACQDRSDRIRVAHDSPSKSSAIDNGELAGRVVFAVDGQGVSAGGASIIVVDTATGKQVLEHLQHEKSIGCLKQLTELETFVLDLAQADAGAGHAPLTATADADGYFILPQVKPGAYLVLAYGRANNLQAIWEQPAIVERYQAVMVKLVEPLLSCSATEAGPPPLPPVVPSAPATAVPHAPAPNAEQPPGDSPL